MKLTQLLWLGLFVLGACSADTQQNSEPTPPAPNYGSRFSINHYSGPLPEPVSEAPPKFLGTALENVAIAGETLGQYTLALSLFTGSQYEKDYELAAYWFARAAQEGHLQSHALLAIMYFEGWGLEKSWAHSFFHAKIAAEGGDKSGQYHLGRMYLNGNGLSKDLLLANYWLQQSSQQGYPPALHDLAVLFFHGLGVKANPVYAFALATHAAQQRPSSLAFLIKVTNTLSADQKAEGQQYIDLISNEDWSWFTYEAVELPEETCQ